MILHLLEAPLVKEAMAVAVKVCATHPHRCLPITDHFLRAAHHCVGDAAEKSSIFWFLALVLMFLARPFDSIFVLCLAHDDG